jgi:hypothetical protein
MWWLESPSHTFLLEPRVPFFHRLSQLVTYEFAVLGLWVYGGVLSEFLKYTHQEGSNANFDTLSESLLSMFQVGVVCSCFSGLAVLWPFKRLIDGPH